MESLFRDLKLAVRGLAKNPAFALLAIGCLAVGIGINSAIFSLVDAVLLEPLPYEDPDGMVMVFGYFQSDDIEGLPLSGHEFRDVRDQQTSFEHVAATISYSASLVDGDGPPERLLGKRVSASLFPLLGVAPLVGRTFTEEEDVYGRNQVVVLSEDLWRRRFDGDRDVVGRKVVLEGSPYEVVGVMPASLEVLDNGVEFWIPIAINWGQLPPRNARGMQVFGRLAPGVGAEQAQADMDRVARSMAEEYPQFYTADSGWGLDVTPYPELAFGNLRPMLLLLAGAVLLVLLIACANVANLLLARASAREKEVGIRTALGAGRRQLARQFLAEGLVLALAGAAGGLLLAFWLPKLLIAINPTWMPRLDGVSLDASVLGFTLSVGLATGLVFGLIPVLQVLGDDRTSAVLKEGGKTSAAGARGRRLRSALVVVEIAVAVVVLVGALLMVGTVHRLSQVDPGFASEDLYTFHVFMGPESYGNPGARLTFVERSLERLAALPGVVAATASSHLPVVGDELTGEIRVERGTAGGEEKSPIAAWRMVPPGYFETLGIDLVSGRPFDGRDHAEAARVVVLDRRLAERLFPSRSAVGQRLALLRFDGSEDWRTVIGVVDAVKHRGPAQESIDQLYVPYAQYAYPLVGFALRTRSGMADSMAAEVRGAVAEIDPRMPLMWASTMEDALTQSIARQRLNAVLFGLFALVALILTLAGVYGVMSYAVAQRTREMGLRLALGAQPPSLLALVLRHSLTLAAAGIVAGALTSLWLSGLVESQLYGVEITEPSTLLAASGILVLLAVLASLVPAVRAMRVDPVVALRYE